MTPASFQDSVEDAQTHNVDFVEVRTGHQGCHQGPATAPVTTCLMACVTSAPAQL
jgi:hypothetical protein